MNKGVLTVEQYDKLIKQITYLRKKTVEYFTEPEMVFEVYDKSGVLLKGQNYERY